MYFGLCNAIEAAGYGVIGAFLITLCQRRLTKDIFLNAFRGNAKTGSMMVFLHSLRYVHDLRRIISWYSSGDIKDNSFERP
jgi:TRAP-type mannitol/chloroaromatic compound transport system permease large subunit